MKELTKIPHGDDKVTVELTVKELMALTGIRFYNNHHVEVSARKKINEALEMNRENERNNGPIDYQLLV